jgi:hypothetical protein
MITVAFANLAALEARATIIFYRPSGTRRLQILPSLIFTQICGRGTGLGFLGSVPKLLFSTDSFTR